MMTVQSNDNHHPDKSKEEIVEAPFTQNTTQIDPVSSEHEEEEETKAKSIFLTKHGNVKLKWWLILFSIVVIAAVIGVTIGVTASKSSGKPPEDRQSPVEKKKCNYQIEISFEYDCDNLPSNYEENFEPALIDYHEYVSIEDNQGLSNVSVTLVDYQPSACIQTPDRHQRNLGGYRELLRGLRKSKITYNLFAFCFGVCPDQALPSVSTSNRRLLQENKNPFLDGRRLVIDSELFPDVLPFLTKFKEIFKAIVKLNVTDAKTNIADTQKIDCANSTTACSSESGKCCGQNNCRCNEVSESFCQATSCSVVSLSSYAEGDGPSCCQYDSCAETEVCRCVSTGCEERDICCRNDFTVCNDFCPLPTSSPTIFPTPAPTSFSTHLQPVFVQKGGDIDGEAAGDRSGVSVSLSSNGMTVAIGAYLNDGINGISSGHVRIYEYLDDSWVQKGGDIDGESENEYSAYAVSLSSDGTIVAISSHSTGTGQVRVYEYLDGSWEKKGSNINGESTGDNFGYAVSLASDGLTVAIGAPQNDGISGTNSGHVRVYSFSGGSWVQKGGDIDGESSIDGSGVSVSLSSDGETVAIGASLNNGNNGTRSGHVRVYEYLDGSWVQKGSDIDGESEYDSFGWSVSLSSDGMTVAIGADGNDGINGFLSGHVRVFGYSDGAWVQKGSDIDGEAASDQSGYAVSLSSDGMTVAIGAYNNVGTNGGGHVRVYGYSDGAWLQIGSDIDGESANDHSGISVSISSDGMTVAIGGYRNDGINGTESGHVRVYQLVSTGDGDN